MFSKNKDKKYKLLKNDTIEYEGRTLYRIKALKETLHYKKGELGGYIQSEANLSQDGSCWVTYGAMVFDNARVEDHVMVKDNAMVYGNAVVEGCATIMGKSEVYEDARIHHNVVIKDRAKIYGNAYVYNDAKIGDCAKIFDSVEIHDSVHIYGDAIIEGQAIIKDHAQIAGNARIKSNDDYAYIRGFGCENRATTFYRVKAGRVEVICGCFRGSLKQFRIQVKERYNIEKCSEEEQVYRKQYLDIASIMEYRFKYHETII